MARDRTDRSDRPDTAGVRASQPAYTIRLAPPEPFDVFYRRELVRVVALARALCGPSRADDVAARAMLGAFRRWPELAESDRAVAWLAGVTVDLATSGVRRRLATLRGLLRLGAPRISHPPLEHEAFWAGVEQLPGRQAQIVALHYGGDLDVEDIAIALGSSDRTALEQLVEARATLAGLDHVDDLDQRAQAAGDELRRATAESVDPVAALAAFYRARAARRRKVIVASVGSVLAIGLVGWLSPRAPDAGPTSSPGLPSPTATAAPAVVDPVFVGPRLLPPLCGAQRLVLVGTAADQANQCPGDGISGPYRSAILGAPLVWPFNVTLPDGWHATALDSFAGIDLAPTGGGSGITVLRATPMGSSGRWSPHRLRTWLRDQTSVRLLGVLRMQLDGFPAWMVDVRAVADAPFTTRCRLVPRCLPLLGSASSQATGDQQVPVVELAPGFRSRLIVLTTADTQAPATIWVWDIYGRSGRQAREVAQSVAFEAAQNAVFATAEPAR